MGLSLFQIDAFAARPFAGNPAAVVISDGPLDEDRMLALAQENNLSETAYIHQSSEDGADYDIRWFTPMAEVDLCGHATLASAWVVLNRLALKSDQVVFRSLKSGLLTVQRGEGETLTLDFPVIKPRLALAETDKLERALGARVIELQGAKGKLLANLGTSEAVRNLKPALGLLAQIKTDGIIVTGEADFQAEGCDFVSRFFAPRLGIAEDPVTGSAHCLLTPFWAKRLGKETLVAKQVSKRGGELHCVLDGDRVLISGTCALYLEGTIHI